MPAESNIPRKSHDFISPRVSGHIVLVPTKIGDCEQNESRLYPLNRTASRVWELIDGERTAGEIGDIIAREYEIARDEAVADVIRFLKELESIGAVRFNRSERGNA